MPKSPERFNDPPLKCPVCSFTSPYATQVGVHKRIAHGILGNSAASVAARKRTAEKLTKGHLAGVQNQWVAPDTGNKGDKANPGKQPKPGQEIAVRVADIKRGADGLLKCPFCSFTTERGTGLGSHLRTHGLKGSSPSTLALRKANPTNQPNQPNQPNPDHPTFKCPDCDFVAKNAGALGNHRRAGKHGQKPSSSSASSASSSSASSDSYLTCPECSASCKGKLGLSMHLKRSHPSYAPAQQEAGNAASNNGNGNAHPHPQESLSIRRTHLDEAVIPVRLQGLIAHTVGRLEAHVEGVAYQNDLPAKQFTKWCAQYLSLSANR